MSWFHENMRSCCSASLISISLLFSLFLILFFSLSLSLSLSVSVSLSLSLDLPLFKHTLAHTLTTHSHTHSYSHTHTLLHIFIVFCWLWKEPFLLTMRHAAYCSWCSKCPPSACTHALRRTRQSFTARSTIPWSNRLHSSTSRSFSSLTSRIGLRYTRSWRTLQIL